MTDLELHGSHLIGGSTSRDRASELRGHDPVAGTPLAMHHGGPYPATTDGRATSVGTAAIERFVRPVCFQDLPQSALPAELQDANLRGLWRLVDDAFTRQPLGG